jgi:hypothetical protein
MVKKIHTMPAIAAVLLIICAAAANAQSDSPTKKASAGRFITDVDRFVSTTDWADIPLQSWFSYINLSADKNIANDYNKSWEIGFAKKLGSVYLGAGYQGRFWKGNTGWGEIKKDTKNGGYLSGSPYIEISPLFGDPPNPTSITWPTGATGTSPNNANNVFSFLVGFDNGSAIKLKFTEKSDSQNAFTRKEGPVIVGQGTFEESKLGYYEGYYRQLSGKVTPSLEYGFSKHIDVGPFSLRPMARVDLEIAFNEKDLSWDNETKYAEFTQNSMSPMLTLDSGANNFWNWDSGALGIGLAEKLKYTYKDAEAKDKDGNPINGTTGQDANVNEWKNVLTPYIRFTQAIDQSFTVKAALDVPFSLEADKNNSSTKYGGTFGFYDATEASPYDTSFDTTKDAAFPKLRLGVQYAFKSGKLADKLLLNAGVTVYLPALLYTDATTTINAEGKVTEVASKSQWEWKTHQVDDGNGNNEDKLQELTLGATFKFGEHAALDFWTHINLQSDDNTLNNNQVWNTLFDWGGILFSLTY